MKIVSVVGARPQFIKLAPLSTELRKNCEEIIVHTGQHFDKEMSESFFAELNIAQPDYNLDVNKGSHGEQTGRMIIELEKVVLKEKPALLIIFGDTNSTLAGALVGAKLNIPVVHVEAGLRSFNKTMPEETNRVVADHVSDYLFAPTQTAMNNLKDENLANKSYLTGDIMVDSHTLAVKKSAGRGFPSGLDINPNDYYLLTLHRPYNVDNPTILKSIFRELSMLDKEVLFPVHPRTRKIIEDNAIEPPENLQMIKPVGYLDFVKLQVNAHKIITDSGGIQKEAYILKKPCITLRSETEWVETVDAGWNLLINPITEKGYAEAIAAFAPSRQYQPVFGQNVAVKMTDLILSTSS